jgi:peptide/nickel transport system substrate-binding protein
MPRRAPLALVACVLLGTACTGTAERHPGEEGQPRPGGTLYVLVEGEDFPHIDPQRTHYTPATNVVRLFARTLTTYRPAAGRQGSELVPDLATDLGRPTNRNTVWQFTLKPNLRWEDGSEVTCRDVKHGVERSFSGLVDGGASIYPRTYLSNASSYRGPYESGAGLESVTCLDSRTVQFELTRPVGDFGYVTALSVFAPVPPGKDTREDYDLRPFSNGPYKVTSYDRAAGSGERKLVLERNRHWNPRTDPARRQYPDRIVVRFGQDADAMTYRMIEDQGDHRYAVALDTRVPPRFVQQVINDPGLSARTVTGTTSGVRYLAINTRSVPDLVCRQAMAYAFNKRAFRAALGGSPYGDYASTILPPTMRAFREFDRYGTVSRPDGDLGRARMLMSGAKCPDKLILDHMQTRLYSQAADVIVESYQRLGIRVVRNPIPADRFFDVVTVPSRQHDLVLTGWVPDFPNGSGTIPALFDGRSIRPGVRGNYNFSLVNDSEVNQLIDAANSEPDVRRRHRMWGELDRKVQEKALVVPIMYDRALQLLGSRVKGGFLHPAYLGVDLCTLGVA